MIVVLIGVLIVSDVEEAATLGRERAAIIILFGVVATLLEAVVVVAFVAAFIITFVAAFVITFVVAVVVVAAFVVVLIWLPVRLK